MSNPRMGSYNGVADNTNGSGSSFRGTNLSNTSAEPMSNSALEAKAKELREQSAKHSQLLTQKLATSQSGQNLLHMGSSLSTLPPDLHTLLQNLHPILSVTETYEKQQTMQLDTLIQSRDEILHQQRRCAQAEAAVDIYKDLVAAEMAVQCDLYWRKYGNKHSDQKKKEDVDNDESDENENDDGMFFTHFCSREALYLIF